MTDVADATRALPPGPLVDEQSVHRAVLPNGLTVLVRRDASAPVVAIVTYVNAGYFDETDDVVGISHVLEHMYFKGTDQFGVGEIARATKAAGGYLNAGTSCDRTSYYTVLPASGFERGLAIQADAYANSAIDAGELARELQVIIQEAKRKADNPAAVAAESLYALLFDKHRIRRWRIGTEEELRRLTRDAVCAFYRRFYRPRNTVLTIVGDVDVEDALALAERHYGALPDAELARDRGPAEPAHDAFRARELDGDITQTQLVFGWHAPGVLEPEAPVLDVLATVLGSGRASRLYRAVRDRSLAAAVEAYHYTAGDVGVFTVHAEGEPARARDAAIAIWQQVQSVREQGVDEAELWRARRIIESRRVRRLESMEGQAHYLAEWEALGDWTLGERHLERMLVASADEVTEVARRYLDAGRGGVLVYRPRETPEVLGDADRALERLSSAGVAERPARAPERAAAPAIARGVALERELAGVRVYRTRYGVPILIRRKPGSPLVHCAVQALGGASDESVSDAGITTLLTRTAIKGTHRRSAAQLAEDVELLGGSIGAATGSESFGWTLSAPSRHAHAALELLSDVVQHPTIPDDAFATERDVALSNLAMLRDDMYRYPLRLLLQAAFPDHPYGIPANGLEESLVALDADRVRAWHAARVAEAPVTIAMVGDGDVDELASAAATFFDELRPAEPASLAPPVWPEGGAARVEHRDKAQTALALAFPAPARGDDDRFVMQLIAGVTSGLGGRFFDELRDRRSLAYTVQAYAAERRLAGMFVAYIATSPQLEETARDGLLEEFSKLCDEPVTGEELARAQEYAIGTHAIRQQSGGAVLGDVLDAWMFGASLEELDEYDARIRAVTPERMLVVAQRWFDERRVVEGVVRGSGRAV
ncbi:MAG TPA: pitrilysin family protein [Gemmatimonadaceae bacterium]|nr:pitrilysin family protein [Gemmatimonadaceae bacterium]